MTGGILSAPGAADFRITPRLLVRETYSDNIRLAPSGQEQSDWVTEVIPGFRLGAAGARASVYVDYAFEQRFYANNSDDNGHNHRLVSNGLLDVYDRKLFLQATGVITQQNLSPLGVQSASNVNLSGNRTETRQVTLSPYWVSRLGNIADLQARYTWFRTDQTGDASVLDTESKIINVSLGNLGEPRNFGWSIVYNKQEIDSTQGEFEHRELESVIASGRLRIYPTLYVLASIGRDDNTYGTTRGSTGGDIYDIGFEWIPSSRTRVRATIGDRYYGTTYALDAETRTRLTTWTLRYVEQIVGTPGVFSVPTSTSTALVLDRTFQNQIPDPFARQQAVDALIAQGGLPETLSSSVDFLTNQVTLSKLLTGGVGIRGQRSALLLHVFRDDRQNESTGATVLGTDPFSITDNVVQTGFSTIFSWRFSARTTGLIANSFTKSRYEGTAREDKNNIFTVGMTHQLQPKVRGAVDYRMTERTSNDASLDTKEHAIIGTLSLTF